MKTINYINLTNGIQFIEDFGLTDYRFIRIQSTHCEQKMWEEIIMSISDDFLMSAAIGHECVVYDCGANKNVPRAVWQGLEWIKFVIHLRWCGVECPPVGRARACKDYFKAEYCKLSKKAKGRIDYFKKFRNGYINIKSITKPTCHDNDSDFYRKIILNCQ